MSQFVDTMKEILASVERDQADWPEGIKHRAQAEYILKMEMSDQDLVTMEDVARFGFIDSVAVGYCMDVALARIWLAGVQVGRKLGSADSLRDMGLTDA